MTFLPSVDVLVAFTLAAFVLILTPAAIRRSPRAMRAVDYLFAGLMGAFAARLMLARNENERWAKARDRTLEMGTLVERLCPRVSFLTVRVGTARMMFEPLSPDRGRAFAQCAP